MKKIKKPTAGRIEMQFAIMRSLIAIGIAFLICFLLILAVSSEPFTAFKAFLLGPLESFRNVSNILQTAAPLIYTGLAVSVIFSASQFNLAAEGAFFLGGLAGGGIAVKLALPYGIHPIAAILAGGLVGAVVCGIPAILKVYLGATEVVSSLMLNYVALFLGVFILNYFLLDVNAGFPASEVLPKTARLATMIPKAKFHAGIILAFVMSVLTWLFLKRSRFGYYIRMVGQNEKFAAYSGIRVVFAILLAQIAGGFIAGMGGASEILGIYKRFEWVALPGYGFDGVIVATLAGNNPLLVPVGALFLAYIRIGADIMSRRSDVAPEILSVVQGVIILLIAAKMFLEKTRHKYIVKNANAREVRREGEKDE